METVAWGIVGCGDVTEVKSGPGFQEADGSSLVAVMRRDVAKARDYARRHGVAVVHEHARDLIDDPAVTAVYIATPPSTHCELALAVARAGKPCLVEKPMALDYPQCVQMAEAFGRRKLPLWVAYYRRSLPRFRLVHDLLRKGEIGRVTSVQIEVSAPLADPTGPGAWRFDPSVAGGGLFFDLGSHCFDLVDYLVDPVVHVAGASVNTGGAYGADDVTAASFTLGDNTLGTGIWNFNASSRLDRMTFEGTRGTLATPIFSDTDVVVRHGALEQAYAAPNPPHVHQPLIQAIVDELRGGPAAPSTGESAARTARVMDTVVGRS